MHPHPVPQVPQIDYGGALVKGVVTAAWMFATAPGFWIAVTIVVLVRVLQSTARTHANSHPQDRSVNRRRQYRSARPDK